MFHILYLALDMGGFVFLLCFASWDKVSLPTLSLKHEHMLNHCVYVFWQTKANLKMVKENVKGQYEVLSDNGIDVS